MFALCKPKHQGSTPRGTPWNLGPKWPTPCWFERRRNSIANCGRTVTDSATVTMESLYRKPPSLFRMVPSLTSYDVWNWNITATTSPPLPQNGGSICSQYTRMATSPKHVIRYTSWLDSLVLGWGFREPRIERRYFRLEQIQDGGRRHVGIYFNWPYLRNRSSDRLHVWF